MIERSDKYPGYEIDTSLDRLDVETVRGFLDDTHWAKGIPSDIVARSLRHADCFGVYKNSALVGFARVISDHATVAYLGDVYIVPAERGRGLSKWLIATILKQPEYTNLRRWILSSRDSPDLYRKFGFVDVPPGRWLELSEPGVYQRLKTKAS